mmetsp:Transcript_41052/g.55946  ORF Transcript_41052/g.55946 Transcript_41052/m.55946 type:complete len:183 (+) Transcript_41052:3414-3962(+)
MVWYEKEADTHACWQISSTDSSGFEASGGTAPAEASFLVISPALPESTRVSASVEEDVDGGTVIRNPSSLWLWEPKISDGLLGGADADLTKVGQLFGAEVGEGDNIGVFGMEADFECVSLGTDFGGCFGAGLGARSPRARSTPETTRGSWSGFVSPLSLGLFISGCKHSSNRLKRSASDTVP